MASLLELSGVIRDVVTDTLKKAGFKQTDFVIETEQAYDETEEGVNGQIQLYIFLPKYGDG